MSHLIRITVDIPVDDQPPKEILFRFRDLFVEHLVEPLKGIAGVLSAPTITVHIDPKDG
jgi:hypothetical protein